MQKGRGSERGGLRVTLLPGPCECQQRLEVGVGDGCLWGQASRTLGRGLQELWAPGEISALGAEGTVARSLNLPGTLFLL